jgi:hypothetical protein
MACSSGPDLHVRPDETVEVAREALTGQDRPDVFEAELSSDPVTDDHYSVGVGYPRADVGTVVRTRGPFADSVDSRIQVVRSKGESVEPDVEWFVLSDQSTYSVGDGHQAQRHCGDEQERVAW